MPTVKDLHFISSSTYGPGACTNMSASANFTSPQDLIFDLTCLRGQTSYIWWILPTWSSSVLANIVAQFPIMLFFAIRTILFLSTTVAVNGIPDYSAETRAAFTTLQTWYNETSGIWDTTGWWNSGNALEMLGNLAVADPTSKALVTSVLNHSFVAAQNHNRDLGWSYSFINAYYDDEGWWALAWIQAYDLTNDQQYLDAAVDIFDDMVKGANTPCSNGTSGIYWEKGNPYVNAISNSLYLDIAAHLANRMANKQYYLNIALDQWAWFQNTGMINSQNLVNDGLTVNCTNNGGYVGTYNQGVLVGALVELEKAQESSNSYLPLATTIAKAAISAFSDSNDVLHEFCEPNCGPDLSQNKGILMRNLQKLQKVAPDPVFLKSIGANADSIWKNDRNSQNELSVTWSGPFVTPANASTHSSAMDALVAAIAFQTDLANMTAS